MSGRPLQYDTWMQGRLTTKPVELFDTVQVKAWGYGARSMDCGRTGVVTSLDRSRVKVDFGKGEVRSISPLCLSLLSRQIDRRCPVCDAARGEKCSSTTHGQTFIHVLMHRDR